MNSIAGVTEADLHQYYELSANSRVQDSLYFQQRDGHPFVNHLTGVDSELPPGFGSGETFTHGIVPSLDRQALKSKLK